MRHPDREFVEYLLQGIREGFRIGFNYQECVCKPAAGNMKSASENPGVVEEYLANEREAGRLLGPMAQKETEGVQISPLVRPGRRFLHRMISLSTIAKELHHHIRLNSSFRSDLAWWYTFLESWNGVSILQVLHRQSPDTALWSDASGSWGCAAVWGPAWSQYQWNERVKGSSIAVMEFLPIIMAAVVWGEYWKSLTIRCN